MEELKQVITEELGISDKVSEISKELYDKIVDSVKHAEIVEKNDVMSLRKCSIKMQLGEIILNCGVTYRNFLSQEFVHRKSLEYITNGSSHMVSKTLYFANFNIFAINGTINKAKAMETIQHEIEHIFQEDMMGHGFGGESLYLKALTDMESDNESRHDIGKLFYCLIKSEQEAFANGLYAYLMDANEPYSEELLKTSETWKIYMSAKNTLNRLQNDFNLKEIFNEYYEKYGVIAKHIKNELDNFLRRIGRVVIKVKQDKILQGWRY